MRSITVFGDSIAWGRGELPNVGWTGRMKDCFERIEYNVVFNQAIPGETSTSLLPRFETEARARSRKKRADDRNAIVIALGTNDARRIGGEHETDPEAFRANVRELVRAALGIADAVCVVGLAKVDEARTQPYEGKTYANADQRAYDAILREEAERSGATFIGVFERFSGDPASYDDGLHPNEQGYDELYGIIAEQFEDLGWL